MTESQSHRHPRVLSVRVGEIFLCLISLNSPICFARRGTLKKKIFVTNNCKYESLDTPTLKPQKKSLINVRRLYTIPPVQEKYFFLNNYPVDLEKCFWFDLATFRILRIFGTSPLMMIMYSFLCVSFFLC